MTKKVHMTIYGAEQVCASCVGAPGSKDTYEWLQAALGRKYSSDLISYEYIDIDHPPQDQKHQDFIEHMIEDDLFYPIVFVNDEMVAEGVPRLKAVYQEIDKYEIPLQLK